MAAMALLTLALPQGAAGDPMANFPYVPYAHTLKVGFLPFINKAHFGPSD